ncbi:MAG: hypothetical protein CVU50_09950 [Candidatus Cloacimonetes bacterium HGW-Cloacimonetes-3]|jgi:hypothetical protein|nr:MAG: hypothetical protein CVU50_09950 [Candidatus Cloacimonetes bacterium HGW-Cloacimonetes-3]
MLKYILIALFTLAISGFYNYSSHPEIPVSRRWLLFFLRSISLGIILLLLISPILYYIQRKSLKPQIVVLEDVSQSMSLKHGSGTKNAILQPSIGKLSLLFRKAGYEVIEHRFANGLEGDDGSSLLGKSLEQLKQDKSLDNLAGIILASDGWMRDENLSAVQQLGLPFYVLADSSRSPSPDLAVNNVHSNRYAYRNEPNTIRADFISENYSGAAEARFMLGNRIISRQSLNLEAGKTHSLDFTHRFTQTGFFNWRVELNPLQNESRLSNNSFPGAIEVLADKERIILISDKPAWDNKFILDAISANPRWEVHTYLSRSGKLYSGETPVIKLVGDNLAAVVIINNGMIKLDSNTLSFISGVHARGVGIMYQGLPVTELSSLLPLQKSNIITMYQGFINPSSAAVNYPMLSPLSEGADDIPPVDYYYVTATAGAEVLASINNPQSSPAIAVKNIGGARSLAFSTLNLWRWQLQSKDEGYNKLIGNCLTWLSNKSTSGYDAIYNSSYMQGEEIIIKLRVEDEIRQRKLDVNPRIRIMDKDNKEVLSDFLTRQDDEYSVKADLAEPGVYSFEISDKESGKSSKGKFVISDSSLENRDFGYNLPLLAWLASFNGGKMIFGADVEAFPVLPAVEEELISRREIALYKKWYILSLFILAFCAELYLRRRWGLL